MSSGLFGVYPVFPLCCLRNLFVFIQPSFRVTFKILLCLYCLSFVLPSELFCIYSAFLWNCFWSPFVFVLFLLCAYFVSVYFLCCFQIVFVFPPFNFYITRRFVFYCFAYVYTCCFVSEAFRGTYSPILCLGERIILRL